MAKAKKVIKAKQAGRSNKVPIGVQIISVLYYIGAVLCVLCGILFIVGANAIVAALIDAVPELESMGVGAGLFIFFGIVLIGLSVLSFFVGRGLWKLKRWAKILAIILAILGVISAVYSIIKDYNFGDIINILLNVVIGAYLIFSKEVKKAFK
jgi:uncharacterized BrkB/YihY/UPF0761 family membrane protein